MRQPSEMIEVLRQFAGFLNAKLEAVTVIGPKQEELPVNLLPSASGKEVILRRSYQIAAVSCLLISLFLAVQGVIRWQRAKSEWQEADCQLVPFRSVKAAYEDSRKTDFRIRQYQKTLQHISLKEPVWASALQAIVKTIPEGCWLEELRQICDRIAIISGGRVAGIRPASDPSEEFGLLMVSMVKSKRSFLFFFWQSLRRRRRRRRDHEANVVLSYKGGKIVFPE